MSKHIWWLKDNNIPYNMEWRVLSRAQSFNPVTGVCRLCLMEKYYIMYNPEDASLNARDEFFQQCMHKWRYLLMKAKGWRKEQTIIGFLKNYFHFQQPMLYVQYYLIVISPILVFLWKLNTMSCYNLYWSWTSVLTRNNVVLQSFLTCFISMYLKYHQIIFLKNPN